MMQAIRQSASGLTLQDFPDPIPGTRDVLVRVHAATVTAGDAVLRKLPGVMYWALVRGLLGIPPRKTIPGHEFAGVVEAVGPEVTRFKPGDRVFGTTTGLPTGANAAFVSVPESWPTGVLAHMPECASFEEAAALPVGGMTALYLLRQAGIQPGEQVLIYGASGSVGTYAVQLARHLGAEVTGVSGSRNSDLVQSLGASHVIDYAAEDFTQHNAAYDVIFDAVGKTTESKSKRALKDGGRFVSIRSNTHETSDALQFLAELLAAGEIRPVIDRRYTLAQTADAYQYVETGRKRGNVVITVT